MTSADKLTVVICVVALVLLFAVWAVAGKDQHGGDD